MNCDICSKNQPFRKPREAVLFITVTQGDTRSKAHICSRCHEVMTEVQDQYRGLVIEEISQQEFNALDDKLWGQ